ncbi:MAG: two pore domain potassium channel family protein, partial [Ktedonobacteraceae bacterium]|nr:two pore domain potassium channel family protein [Ktedonobacteraceae bacterium]
QWSLGSALAAPEKNPSFATDLYMSGTTFFTLGLGDVTPREGWARFFTVMEAGLGFGFLALVIGYVPVIYQTFSRREAQISLLDARAGSPPCVGELLRRHVTERDVTDLVEHLRGWEHWCSELMESHLSYPVLMYYRSQHDRQSWLASLTTILDISALIMVGVDGISEQVGRFTFAIGRHAAVDLAQSLGKRPVAPEQDRLPAEQFDQLRELLSELGLSFRDDATAREQLAELRNMYEPYVNTLSQHLLMQLPEWLPSQEDIADDWQTSPWDHFTLTIQRPRSHGRRQKAYQAD